MGKINTTVLETEHSRDLTLIGVGSWFPDRSPLFVRLAPALWTLAGTAQDASGPASVAASLDGGRKRHRA